MTAVKRLKGDPLTRYEVDAAGCWIWQGALTPAGYGALRLEGRRSAYAHRYFYEQLVGAIPETLEIDHLCRVRHCVNPEHLEAVTHKENCERAIQPASLLTHCVNGHAFDTENTYQRPRGGRACRACDRQAGARYRAKRGAAKAVAA